MRIVTRHAWMLAATLVAISADSISSSVEAAEVFRGATSCATFGCHGNTQPKAGIRQDEFGVWLKDPHSRAYNDLFNERSRRILENLVGTPEPGGPSERATAIWKNCLACHNTTDDLAGDKSLAAKLPEGVGCESCHGSADGDWYNEHFRNEKAFAALSPDDKSKKGLRVLEAASSRAETCVKCHVAGNGVVDHDLIAAGHPALKFEFRSYLAAMPHHWREQPASSDRLVDEWLAGQVAVATAAIDRVHRESAAAESTSRKTRPVDLAEHDCDTCHHGLSGGLEAGAIVPQKRTLPEWGTWNLGLVEVLSADTTIGEPDLAKAVAELKQAANDGYRTKADVLRVKAASARDRLREWSDQDSVRSWVSRDELRAVIAQATAPAVHSDFTWDYTAQRYFALLAIQKDQSGRELAAIRDALRYPTHMAHRDSKAHRDQVWQTIREAAAAR